MRIAIVFALALVPALAWADEGARLVEIVGDVQVLTPRGSSTPVHAALDQTLGAGAIVVTGARSTASLRLADGSLLVLGERSRLRLTRVLFDGTRRSRSITLMLEVGQVLADVAEVLGVDSLFELQTPHDRVRARSGQFMLRVDPEGTAHLDPQSALLEASGQTTTTTPNTIRSSTTTSPAHSGAGARSESLRRDPLDAPVDGVLRDLLEGSPAQGLAEHLTAHVLAPTLDQVLMTLGPVTRLTDSLVPPVPLVGVWPSGGGSRVTGRVDFR